MDQSWGASEDGSDGLQTGSSTIRNGYFLTATIHHRAQDPTRNTSAQCGFSASQRLRRWLGTEPALSVVSLVMYRGRPRVQVFSGRFTECKMDYRP